MESATEPQPARELGPQDRGRSRYTFEAWTGTEWGVLGAFEGDPQDVITQATVLLMHFAQTGGEEGMLYTQRTFLSGMQWLRDEINKAQARRPAVARIAIPDRALRNQRPGLS